MDDAKIEKFRELLEQNHQWPDFYTFKFIVKAEDQDRVHGLASTLSTLCRPYGRDELSMRASRSMRLPS